MAIGRTETDRYAGIAFDRQNKEQLFQIGPTVLGISESNHWGGATIGGPCGTPILTAEGYRGTVIVQPVKLKVEMFDGSENHVGQ